MIFEEADKLVMIGDSITDAGRSHPICEARNGGLGSGYVRDVQAILGAVCPELKVTVLNVGTSGHTVRDLAARWQRDVLDLRPDWLSVMIGINDVWRKFDSPKQPERHVPLVEYEESLRRLVRQTRPQLKGMLLATPYYIEPNRNDPMRSMMDDYGEVVRQIAQENDCLLVDTQAAFDAALGSVKASDLAGDGIHPGAVGHMILARTFLEPMGVRISPAPTLP